MPEIAFGRVNSGGELPVVGVAGKTDQRGLRPHRYYNAMTQEGAHMGVLYRNTYGNWAWVYRETDGRQRTITIGPGVSVTEAKKWLVALARIEADLEIGSAPDASRRPVTLWQCLAKRAGGLVCGAYQLYPKVSSGQHLVGPKRCLECESETRLWERRV